MLQLDPEDVDEDENAPKVLTALASTNANPQMNQTDAASSIITEADQVILENYKVGLYYNRIRLKQIEIVFYLIHILITYLCIRAEFVR